jgi:hypothetical protein
MIERIKSHNYLNGVVFCIAEFSFMTLVIAPFAIYCITHGRWVYAVISVGIMLNCLTVVAFGIQSLRHKQTGNGLRVLLDKKQRDQVMRNHATTSGYTHSSRDHAVPVWSACSDTSRVHPKCYRHFLAYQVKIALTKNSLYSEVIPMFQVASSGYTSTSDVLYIF